MSPRYALDSWTTCPEHGYQHRFTVQGRLYEGYSNSKKVGAYREATCGCRYEQRDRQRPVQVRRVNRWLRPSFAAPKPGTPDADYQDPQPRDPRGAWVSF